MNANISQLSIFEKFLQFHIHFMSKSLEIIIKKQLYVTV